MFDYCLGCFKRIEKHSLRPYRNTKLCPECKERWKEKDFLLANRNISRLKKDYRDEPRELQEKQGWQIHEDELFEEGRKMPRSGGIPGYKGDGDLGEFRIEAKSTSKDSLQVRKDWLTKISWEAFEAHKKPALAIRFDNMDRNVEQDWIAIPFSIFKATFLVKE